MTGETANLSLTLDGKPFASAAGNPQMPLIKGSHLLALTDPGGQVMDRVRFPVQ